MHKNEFPITIDLVHHLIHTQFPEYAHLTITPVQSNGTDNAIYKLGEHLCVRLPRIPQATTYKNKHIITASLASQLPLAIPVPIAQGSPNKNYSYHWSIYTWVEGENAFTDHSFDQDKAAADIAHFLIALHNTKTTHVSPSPRGKPLITEDQKVRTALEQLHNDIDTHAAQALWEKCLKAPEWHKQPVLIHGDLLPTNILVHNNHVNAIIDFDFLGTGEPACDLLPAWSMLSADARKTFRNTMGVDDATWLHGKGWALSIALIIIPYYKNTNPTLVAIAQRMIDELIKRNHII